MNHLRKSSYYEPRKMRTLASSAGYQAPIVWNPPQSECELAASLGLLASDPERLVVPATLRGLYGTPMATSRIEVILPITDVLNELVFRFLPFDPGCARVAAVCILERQKVYEYGVRTMLAKHRIPAIFKVWSLAHTKLRFPKRLTDWSLDHEAAALAVRDMRAWLGEMTINLRYLRHDRDLVTELLPSYSSEWPEHVAAAREVIAAGYEWLPEDMLVSKEGSAFFVPAHADSNLR